jgi:hypothetical protein
MNRDSLESMLESLRRLPPEERIAFADEVDRLVWRDRVQVVLASIRESLPREGNPPSDEEVDATVADVRAEQSLYERYWTLRRSSAA